MRPSRPRVLRALVILALLVALSGSWSAFPPCC
jgi:hypothetical protein